MNCPQHVREKNDPEALKNNEEINETEYLLTGPHFGEDCNS